MAARARRQTVEMIHVCINCALVLIIFSASRAEASWFGVDWLTIPGISSSGDEGGLPSEGGNYPPSGGGSGYPPSGGGGTGGGPSGNPQGEGDNNSPSGGISGGSNPGGAGGGGGSGSQGGGGSDGGNYLQCGGHGNGGFFWRSIEFMDNHPWIKSTADILRDAADQLNYNDDYARRRINGISISNNNESFNPAVSMEDNSSTAVVRDFNTDRNATANSRIPKQFVTLYPDASGNWNAVLEDEDDDEANSPEDLLVGHSTDTRRRQEYSLLEELAVDFSRIIRAIYDSWSRYRRGQSHWDQYWNHRGIPDPFEGPAPSRQEKRDIAQMQRIGTILQANGQAPSEEGLLDVEASVSEEHETSEEEFDEETIISGDDARHGQFPYVVYYTAVINGRGYSCGGGLISTRWVLTAAHCLKLGTSTATAVTLRFGELDRSEIKGPESPGAFEIAADRIVPHPRFVEELSSSGRILNDIGLVRASKTVPLSRYVQPVCLPSSDWNKDQFDGKTALVAGWGLTQKGSTSRTNMLQYASFTVYSLKDCQRYLGGISITDKHMCYWNRNVQGTCSGDSGSAVVVVEGGKATLIAAHSFSSCTPSSPSGGTRVSEYLEWIVSVTNNA